MKLANISKRQRVIEIIAQSFHANPTLTYCTGQGKRKMERLKAIAAYAFDFAIKRNGVYISDDNKGVAICYHSRLAKPSLHDKWLLLKMIVRSLSFRRVIRMSQHNRTIKKIRPQHQDYYYFWFFGAISTQESPGAANDLKNAVLRLADITGTDIYAETTIEKNKNVYQRYGFEVYQQWRNEKTGITVWFMRRVFSNTKISC